MKTGMFVVSTAIVAQILAVENVSDTTSKMKWQWEGFHALKLSGVVTPRVEIADSTATTAHGQVDLYAQVPIIRQTENYFGMGIVFRTVVPQLDMITPDSLSLATETAQMGQVAIAWWHKLGKITSLYTEYNGGVSGVWGSPVESQSHLLFSYVGFDPKPNRFYRAGVAVAYQFGTPAFYPLLGADIGFTNRFALDCMFPTHVAARFKVTNKVELGAKGSYTIGGIGFDTKSETPINYSWSYFSGGAYGDFRLYKDLIFRVEGGEQFLRKIELKTIGGDSIVTLKPKPAPFASVSIRWQV